MFSYPAGRVIVKRDTTPWQEGEADEPTSFDAALLSPVGLPTAANKSPSGYCRGLVTRCARFTPSCHP